MKALLSGQAGVAVLLDGDHMVSFNLDSPDQLLPVAESDIPHIFADTTDVIQLDHTSCDRVVDELERLWRKDRALHLTLILLDSGAETETRRMAAEYLEEQVVATDARDFVCNRLYVAPLPAHADLSGAQGLAAKLQSNQVSMLLNELKRDQARIQRCRETWDSLRSDLFGGIEAKQIFQQVAVDSGIFRRLAGDECDYRDIEAAPKLYIDDSRFQEFENCAEILTTWATAAMRAAAALTPAAPAAAAVPAAHRRFYTGRTSVTEEGRHLDLILETPMLLETHQLQDLVGGVSSGLVACERSEIGDIYRYELRYRGGLFPSSAHALEHAVELQLLKLAIRGESEDFHGERYSVWDVDTRLFPNCCTEILSALMLVGTEFAREKLSHIRDCWQEEVRGNTQMIESTNLFDPDHKFYYRLRDQIARRAELLAWIDQYLSGNLEAASRYAEAHGLI